MDRKGRSIPGAQESGWFMNYNLYKGHYQVSFPELYPHFWIMLLLFSLSFTAPPPHNWIGIWDMKGSQKGEIFLSGIIIRWLSQKVMYILSKFICKNSFPALLKCTAGKTQFCWLDAFPVSGLNSCLNSVYLNRRTFLKLLSMKRPTFRLRNEHGRDSKIRTQVHTTKTFILPMSE